MSVRRKGKGRSSKNLKKSYIVWNGGVRNGSCSPLDSGGGIIYLSHRGVQPLKLISLCSRLTALWRYINFVLLLLLLLDSCTWTEIAPISPVHPHGGRESIICSKACKHKSNLTLLANFHNLRNTKFRWIN